MSIGTADDGAFHQVLESLPQEPRHVWLGCRDDESHITGRTGRPSRRHSDPGKTLSNPSTVRPNSGPPQPDTTVPAPQTHAGPTAFSAGGPGFGTVTTQFDTGSGRRLARV
ncbi:hypothetical protein GCM10010335_39790 [Streptomyces galbus]|nr:hypothetical protein GCM10010335_39790 [Streptomyces galbus]